MRKAVAGLLLGLCAAVIVLGLDVFFSTISGGTAVNPLDTIELITCRPNVISTSLINHGYEKKSCRIIVINNSDVLHDKPHSFDLSGREIKPRFGRGSVGVRLRDSLIQAATPFCVPHHILR